MPIINTISQRNILSLVEGNFSSISNRFFQSWIVIAIFLLAAPVASRGMTIVSLTFDDANADQLVAIPMLAAHGMHGTFYIPSGRVGAASFLTWSDLLGLQTAGHEIAGHTIDHLHLTTLSLADQKHQICDDRTSLLTHGLAAMDFAYPFGDADSTTEIVVAGCGYTSARDIGGIVSPDGCRDCAYAETIPSPDPFMIRAPSSVKDAWTIADLENAVTTAEAHGGGWLIFTFHHICLSCNTYAIDPTTLDQFLAWLALRAASGTIVRTVREVMEDTL
jgi:peptidoglycan/xylan/chitin deacetylase (PgdA/CDA1 family)